ncbi:sugar ABC transporter permease [Terrarubrum flagellatum]|uniref:carbohydrate ABC transporter permease n=1 Tax=Terrirubrum flagellatum TaxID=2895980 RepID=UPI003144F577
MSKALPNYGSSRPVSRPLEGALDRLFDSRNVWSVTVAATALYLLFFVGYPILYNVIMSFQEVSVSNVGRLDRPWVGFANYQRLIGDPLFPLVVKNTIVFVSLSVILQCACGLALALFFQQRFPGSGALRGVILAGWILPPLVVGAIWKWLLASDNGVFNYALQSIGLISGPVYWLSDPSSSLLAVTLANVWFGVPFNMILLAAGLSGIPREIYEAAMIDGAGPFRRFTAMTLPMLRPTLYALVALSTIYTMRSFDVIWTMTHGGPIDSSNVFPIWSYKLSFDIFDFAGGAAASTMMLIVVFFVALIYVRSVRAEARA